ncbi:MAG: AraC family transcriptional regulator [Planctomycetes bacterium]|nr:AraC family transcriptional regulator [Planctomycetota bacterium]
MPYRVLRLMPVPGEWERALDERLRAACLRAGESRTTLSGEWTHVPFAVIGQSLGAPLRVLVEDGRTQRVTGGGAYILPPGKRWRVQMDPSKLNVFRWSHLSATFFGGVDLFDLFDAPLAVPPQTGARIGRINRALASTGAREGEFPLRALAGRRRLALELLDVVLSVSVLRPDAARRLVRHARIEPVLRYMESHLGAPVPRGTLARMAHLSESRFHDVFRAATGQAPLAYWQRLRLQRAQELLIAGSDSIADVASACGFGDAFHFSRLFKAFCGLSPRAYREQRRRELGPLLAAR